MDEDGSALGWAERTHFGSTLGTKRIISEFDVNMINGVVVP